MHRARVTLLCVTLVLAGACGRGDQSAAASGEAGGTIVIASTSDADALLLPITFSEQGRMVSDLVFDRLAEIGDDMGTIGDRGFTPRLADRCTWSTDSLSVAFHLNPRARWHDGQPVRASDVRFSIALYKNPKLPPVVAPLITNVDSASVRDSLTAVVWFHAHRPEAFYDIAYQVQVLPEHVFKDIPPEKLATSEAARHPVGSGRFRFVKWEPGTRIELVSDTANYRGRAKLDRVIFSIAPDNEAALTQVLSGQADVLDLLTPDQVARVMRDTSVRPMRYGALQYAIMGMNLRDPSHHAAPHPLFGDVRMRRAISMALDRRAMLRNVFDSVGRLGHGPFPSSLPTADTTLRVPAYDGAHAAALLDSLGWRAGADGMRSRNGRPLSFSLIVPTSSKMRMSYAILIQDQLKRVGVQVRIDAMEGAKFGQQLEGRNFDAMLNSGSTDPSPSGAAQYWGSEGAKPGGSNFVSYVSPAFDALLDSALAAWDPAVARRYAVRAYQTVADDAPAAWLYDAAGVGAIHRRIRTTHLRPDEWWAHLEDWSIPPAERIDRDRIGLGSPKP